MSWWGCGVGRAGGQEVEAAGDRLWPVLGPLAPAMPWTVCSTWLLEWVEGNIRLRATASDGAKDATNGLGCTL